MSDESGTAKPSRAAIALRRQGVPYSAMTWERLAPLAVHGEQSPANSVVRQYRSAADIPINWEWIQAEIGGDRIDRLGGEDAPAPEDRVIPPTQRG